MPTKTEIELPKYCYLRGDQIWCRLKEVDDVWRNKSTGCTIGEVEKARRVVAAALKQIEANRALEGGPVGTVREYCDRWLKDREKRGIDAAHDERARLELHALPIVGKYKLSDFKPRHVRDMVRALRAKKDDEGDPALAPRTVLHIFQALHAAMQSAVIDELIATNPVIVDQSELPSKVDADPEWRPLATYQMEEVIALVSDPVIPIERRVQYALKALAGLRHGEVAALAWRHISWLEKPLAKLNVVRAHNSRTNELKRTKTEVSREVPVHPELARLLKAWHEASWAKVYGRAPTTDDLVVPTRTFKCVAAKDACEAMKRDMSAIDIRVDAGEHRDRGGHDLRSWFITQLIEDGAESAITCRFTHAPPKTAKAGYERFSWKARCREMAKLEIKLPRDPLKLVTDSLQSLKNAAARWTSVATPTGFEPPDLQSKRGQNLESSTDNDRCPPGLHDPLSNGPVTREIAREVEQARRVLSEVERAARELDLDRAQALLRRLSELELGDVTHRDIKPDNMIQSE